MAVCGRAGCPALCGSSILVITAIDMLRRRRGESLRPVRVFDIALALVLLAPSLIELHALWRELNL